MLDVTEVYLNALYFALQILLQKGEKKDSV